MSKIPPLRCLFCKQRNPAGAKYCNDCASPLHLQPCNQCGAIDNRTAISCYKCGSEFSLPAATKRARVAASRKSATAAAAPEVAAAPDAALPESVPASPILEDQIAKPALNEGGFSIERAFLSKSTAQMVGMSRRGLRREVTETQAPAVPVADQDLEHLNPDSVHSAFEQQQLDEAIAPEIVQYPVLALHAVEPQLMDDTVESDMAGTASGSRRARRLALLTAFLAAIAVTGYYYLERPAQQLVQEQSGQEQSAALPAPSVPDRQLSVGAAAATTAAEAVQVDPTSAPKDTAAQPVTGAVEVEKARSPAARAVAKPLDGPASVSRPAAMPAAAASSERPSPVIDPGIQSRRTSPIPRECTEAVAALGLCSPSK